MPTDARVVWMPGGVRTEIHLAAEDTGGAFCLLVDHPPAGWSLPAHRHRNEAETIHIIEAGAATPDGETDPASALASAVRHGWEFTEP